MENLFKFEMKQRLEEKMDSYEKEIEKKQKLALLIESICSLNDYSVKSRDCIDFYDLSKELGYPVDLAINTYVTLINEFLNELIEDNFIVDLDKESEVLDFYETSKKFEKVNPIRNSEILRNFYRMGTSFSYIKKTNDTHEINLIELLLKHEQFDIIIELLLSSKLDDEQKFSIFDIIIKKYSHKLKDIFETVPASYYNSNENKKTNCQNLQQLLNQNLKQIVSNKNEYIEDTIRKLIKASYRDSLSLVYASNVIKFFIQRNLVDINEIYFTYFGKKITTAAAAYVTGKDSLADELYELPEYSNNDSKIKDDSDIVIAKYLVRNNPHRLANFIENHNYTNNKEKFFELMNYINKKNSENYVPIYSEENIEYIIKALLKKTKKEDYKAIKKELEDRKVNEELLLEKRQEFVSLMGSMSESLLEQVPAKKKIKELEFMKK